MSQCMQPLDRATYGWSMSGDTRRLCTADASIPRQWRVQRHPFPAAAIYIDAMRYVATVAAGFA
jgi:hypothetical protein